MDDVVVRKSEIQGKDVFAARDFRKGEIILEWDTSEKLTSSQAKKLSEKEKKYLYQAGKCSFILQKPPERYVNHSCEPNTFVRDMKDVALRDIKKGEEITSDYSKSETGSWDMECHCGSRNCRKTIKPKKET